MPLFRGSVALGLILAALSVLTPGVAEASGTGTQMTITLGQSLLPADGTSSTQVTVTVTDSANQGVTGDTVIVGTSGSQSISPVIDNADGTYTATITTTTTPGPSTITATDLSSPVSPQSATLTQYGPASSVTLGAFSPSTITADGASTATATVTVTDAQGDGVPGESLTVNPSGAPVTSSIVDNHDGTYTLTATAGTIAGTANITVSDGSITSNQSTLTEAPGPPATVTLGAFSPGTITADGASTATATVTVTDANGNGVPGQTLTMQSTGAPANGSFVDNGGGTYTLTATAGTTAGTANITVSDGPLTSNQQTLTLAPGSATSVTLGSFAPGSVTADGTSTATATVTVTDAHGNGVPGQSLTVNASGPPVSTSIVDNQDGTYTLTATAGTTAGTANITVSDGTITSNQSTLTEAPGPPHMTLTLSPTSVPVGGTAVTATAVVSDSFGNPISNDPVTFATNGQQGGLPVTVHTDTTGTATTTFTSSTTAGTSTITAGDSTVSSSAVLTQTAGSAAFVALSSVAPGTLTADGHSTATATITVADFFGNHLPGQALNLNATGSSITGSIVDNQDGTYTLTAVSGTKAGTATVTVSDGTVQSNPRTLTLVHGPVQNLALTLAPNVVTADGISRTTATVTVADANGNPIAGEPIQISATNRHVRVGKIADHGNGTYTANATSSNTPATLTLIATDPAASPATSAEATLTETRAPTLLGVATMEWSFAYTPHYTVLRTLMLTGAPVGAHVLELCHGRGCPFHRRVVPVTRHRSCRVVHGHKRCLPVGSFDLSPAFRGHRLARGASLEVEILRPGWIGKDYRFMVRPAAGPRIQINCLAPGGTKPGLGCS